MHKLKKLYHTEVVLVGIHALQCRNIRRVEYQQGLGLTDILRQQGLERLADFSTQFAVFHIAFTPFVIKYRRLSAVTGR